MILRPKAISPMLKQMLNAFCSGDVSFENVTMEHIPDGFQSRKLVFALDLNELGSCLELNELLLLLVRRSNVASDVFLGSIGTLLVHSSSELFTKSAASHILFLANQLGCSFIGHPMVEATESLMNFATWQKQQPGSSSLLDICLDQCKRLGKRLLEASPLQFDAPRILALHASRAATSNTLMLWDRVYQQLRREQVEVLNVENGTIHDCIGCSFKTCIHYSKQDSCFYGGFMVKEIMPAIEKCDALVMLCPNYNDAVSANLAAVINRTTALYRKTSFHDKYLFAIVVSGNSGGDSVARQLLDALTLNKGFRVAPHAMLMKTANDPGSIKKSPDFETEARRFGDDILKSIKRIGL